MEKFDCTYKYKLIYVFSMPYDTHKGLLKIGEATLTTDTKPEYLTPNCRELNQAAIARIKGYTATASVNFKLEYTELAVLQKDGYSFTFKDKDVHKVLMNSGIHKVQPNGATGEEWFATTVDVAIRAILAVKQGKSALSATEKTSDGQTVAKIDFRDEQKAAIEQTIKAFKKENEMLWYAKMRFGKTLTALEVVRRSQYRRVIIVTHRPVVSDGWSTDFAKIFYPGSSEHDYSFELKTNDSAYTYDEKIDLENDLKIKRLDKDGDYFLYFASIQDLRGSKRVGGKFNKNNAVFDLDWDLIIVDEAHEGTQTELGDHVIKQLRKASTKVLALSGTPFNLLDKFGEDNVYTWDYVMEQKKKAEWDAEHYGDHNPYADLPQMHIYTYDLGEKLKKYVSDEYDTKAFNFREFFRVWSRGPHGKREIPQGAVEGNFVHEADVRSFLDLMAKEDKDSIYPFSTDAYRNMFRHTLWMVPGVKEAKALSEMLRHHPVFMHFGIANVAGEGDTYEEDHAKDALELVRKTIRENKYSITLSCGKLTTGVTVPEWTAVLMLSGSYSTAASQYMQTIFRVQSAGCIDGKQKTDCYVFDFAPDRTLKVLTETVHLSRKPGKNQKKRREAMTEFLNYCPVIAIAGSRMTKYSVNSMMEQVKQIYAERAVNSGFEDESIYNDELLKLDDIDASKFNALKDIIGASKAQKKKDSVVVNGQGLTDEQIAHIDDGDDEPVTPPSPPTPEETADRLKKKQAKEARKKAIDILRGISIRMPLMIYGANVPIDEDIDIDRFVELVDDTSWAEFMPKGVTKPLFADFTKYYDRDVFIAAGKRIRKLAAAADKETPTRRVKLIAEIFRHFKNPDKETVLTPWRVVNMHMSDTLGGWCFFNEQFEDDTQEEKHRLDEPRFVDQGEVTKEVFREDTHILEINSKTGLYPLYVAYSVYRQKLEDTTDDDWEPAELQAMWEEVLRDNIYVICKTPMAKYITKRTLTGYHDNVVNAHYFDDLVNMLKSKPEQFKKKILKGSYWGKEVKEMKFDAIVGNPPYQEETAQAQSTTNGQAPRTNVFQYFQMISDELSCGAISLIYPGARWIHRFGKGLAQFGLNQINDKTLVRVDFYQDANEIFKDVAIADGITVVYKNKSKAGDGFEYVYHRGNETIAVHMDYPGEQLLPLNPNDGSIISKVNSFVDKKHLQFMFDRVLPRTLYGIESNFVEENPLKVTELTDGYILKPNEIKLFANDKAGKAGRSKWYVADKSIIESGKEYLSEWQVVVSSANAGGQKRDNQIEIIDNHSAFGRSRVALGSFKTEKEAVNFYHYCKTTLIRFMFLMTDEALTSLGKKVPDIMDYSDQNTLVDFKKDLNPQLYALVGLTSDEISYIESIVKSKEAGSFYEKMLSMSYDDIVKLLLKKYGAAKHDYFTDRECTIKNKLVSRTAEGLFCHHIDEDKAIMLSNDEYAARNPFEYQKKNRLVYCNLLEHLLLHVKIAEEPRNPDANENELPGIGGAINYLCKQLNDIYAGKEPAEEWRKTVASKVQDSFDDYIRILRHLWSVIEQNPLYKTIITKQMLCTGWDGKVVDRVLEALGE